MNLSESRARLGRWFAATIDAHFMVELGVLARHVRRHIGLSDWQPIYETSMGNEIGRARFNVYEEAYCWHLDDDSEVIEHDPRFRIVEDGRAVEEYFGR